MIFSKIKLTKAGTLEATYKNEDGDVIQFAGANLVHKDLKEALQGLIPHLAIITEDATLLIKSVGDTLFLILVWLNKQVMWHTQLGYGQFLICLYRFLIFKPIDA